MRKVTFVVFDVTEDDFYTVRFRDALHRMCEAFPEYDISMTLEVDEDEKP